MRLGLLADVRGLLGPLRHALRILREEEVDRVACLGSTVEGGPDDEAVLAELRAAGVLILPSPHDALSALGDLPVEEEVGGIRLAHETPGGSDDTLWLTGVGAPTLLHARELLARGEQRACGDLYGPMVYALGPMGPWRRMLIGPDTVEMRGDSWLVCPGSVAACETSRHGGSVMVVDELADRATVVTFDAKGHRRPARKARILVYSAEFDAHRPEPDMLELVDLVERKSADEIAGDVANIDPDLVLLDYHLEGQMSGIDAIVALRDKLLALPAPILTIAGNPSDSEGMKAAGAMGGLPHAYLKDVLTRTIHELAG